MPPQRFQPNARLPQSILDEIASDSHGTGRHDKSRSNGRNRKAQRKAERQTAKEKRAQHFNSGHNGRKRRADVELETTNAPGRKKRRITTDNAKAGLSVAYSQENESRTSSKLAGKPTGSAKLKLKGKELSVKGEGKAEAEGSFPSKSVRSRQEFEEDVYISMLEKKLGIDKKKKGKSRYNAAFEADGLLDLLVDLDEKDGEESTLDAMLHTAETDESEPDFEYGGSDDTAEVDEGESEEEESDVEEVENEGDEWPGFSSSIDTEVPEGSQAALRNAEGSETKSHSTYIPPHLRKSQESGETDVKLTRTLKGLLNKLSEQNIDSILKEVESLYRNHRRHDITSTLTNLIIEGTCSHSILLDSYVALHAGLVASLHKIIGVELAAYFVQTVVAQFELHYQKTQQLAEEDSSSLPDDSPTGKECSNLLVLISDLYNYRVISCTLVYDIIRLILEGELKEFDIELILKLARGSGTQLRQDDPSALKDIIQIVQSNLGSQSPTSSRTRFMVETLTNLKNNKIKNQINQGGNESKERISKFVAGIDKKYHVHAHEPLRISLDDLHQADSKGKWWLVGAAWGGDPLVDRQDEREAQPSAPVELENALLKLARKQGMNTDVRRSVFVVLMSSDDYVDACDRLSQLNLTEIQQREIIRVLLHCCGNEKTYNPYYTLIGQHLCRLSHSHKVTLQYCLWDFLRSLGETGVGGAEMAKSFEDDDKVDFELDRISSTRMANIAKAYAWWIAKDSVAITIMKTLDFVTLKTKTRTFLRQLFTQLFISSQDASAAPNMNVAVAITKRDSKALEEIMLKALRVPVLARGILHFITTTYKRVEEEDEKTRLFVEWAAVVSKETLQMGLETGVLD